MTVATGTFKYQLGTAPVTGCGFSYSKVELDTALSGSVAQIVYDVQGNEDYEKELSSLEETGFGNELVESMLADSKQPENWRVGEALAEAYLVHQKDCFFPWPISRDHRKRGSSLPGADLVGFQSNGSDNYFAFVEVKTSTDGNYPPKVIYGPTGFQKQLEDLKSKVEIRKDLVEYLYHRAKNTQWKSRWNSAVKKFLQNKTNVRIFGFLVRDVEPNEKDLILNQLSNNL